MAWRLVLSLWKEGQNYELLTFSLTQVTSVLFFIQEACIEKSFISKLILKIGDPVHSELKETSPPRHWEENGHMEMSWSLVGFSRIIANLRSFLKLMQCYTLLSETEEDIPKILREKQQCSLKSLVCLEFRILKPLLKSKPLQRPGSRVPILRVSL